MSSAADAFETFDEEHEEHEEHGIAEAVEAAEAVEIRGNGLLVGSIGAVAAVVSLVYLSRAAGGGSALDWLLALAMGGVAAAYLASLRDSRTPLLVADEQGIRLRLGRTWRGMAWESLECVEHEPRRGVLRDGRLVLVLADPDAVLDDLDRSGRRQAAIARRLHGSPLAVPLGLSTVVSGADGDLTLALERLAGDPARVVELVPDDINTDYDTDYDAEDRVPWGDADEDLDDTGELPVHPALPEVLHDVIHAPRPTVARGLDFLGDRLRLHREPEVAHDEPEPTVPLVASATPLPLRDPVAGARVEVRFEGAAALQRDPAYDEHAVRVELPEAAELHRAEDPYDVTVIGVEPAAAPVIGPELAAARARLTLSVDQLAERTRIRPHVIESIEVDDFAPCGGDFYARGHLRTLARVLGVDAAPLLAAYDDRYADAPIDAKRVFEAELATGEGGPIRSIRGGVNWSVLVAAVMAVVLAWSIARLVMDSPVNLQDKDGLVLNGSPSTPGRAAAPVPVKLDATAGGAHVVVLDGAGEEVFDGDLAFGETRTLKAAPPVRVQSSDGALQVTVDGQARGPLGAAGQPAQNTFAAAS